MIKFWKIFLPSILVTSFIVGESKLFEKIFINTAQHSPFHPDITFFNSGALTNTQKGDLSKKDKDMYTNEIDINWTNYANSWSQFLQYYGKITLYATGYARGKTAPKNSFTNLNIETSSINQQDNWHDNTTLRNTIKYNIVYTSHSFPLKSYEKAGVYYDAIHSGDLIKLRFYLWTNGYQYMLGTRMVESHVDFNGGIISSSWKLDNIKSSLSTALANQITLTSDYSGSLEDKNNITDPTRKGNDETTLINNVIIKTLQEDYIYWKQYIQPIAFSDKSRLATTVFKFFDPINNRQQVWEFKTPINILLSHDYWGKSLKDRLRINPGKIVNPLDSTKGMVDDQAIQLEPNNVSDRNGGNLQYHTTAHIEFDGAEDSNEWMTINNEPVEVLNNKFIYDMVDNRINNDSDNDDDNDGNNDTKKTNVYDIVLHRKVGSATEETYQIKYTINNLVPTLTEKWYGWNPEKNPNQKSLITETLPNGKTNPKYDKEVNPKTGTKTQIIWVKKKTEYPFPLDPLDKNGEVINSEENPSDYDLGFIAEGSVVGMGVQQLFNPSEVAKISREGVNKSLNKISNPTTQQQLTTINPDTNNKYWSWEGMWHYITRTSDQLAYEKYVLIGDNYQEKYSRFLDILNDSNIAVDFWTTVHGLHLKNYLAREKLFDSKEIAELNYEQVASYWKEYTSDIIAQRISPNPEPVNYLDLSKVDLYTIKMNLTTVELIKQEIINQVRKQLSGVDLIYTADYQFYPFDDESINKLLDYDSSGNATINLMIKALTTSTKAIGSKTIKIINNTHYDPDNVVDLSKIEFTPAMQPFSFHDFTVEQLKQWILTYIDNTFKGNKNYLVALEYDIDYRIMPFDDETLAQFIASKERISLEFTVYAQDSSLKAINATKFVLINDPEAAPAPPVPPTINPEPNPTEPGKDRWITKKTNLIILSVVVVLGVGGIGTIIFFKYRLKKGIGGKKLKTKAINKNLDNKANYSETKAEIKEKVIKNPKIKAKKLTTEK